MFFFIDFVQSISYLLFFKSICVFFSRSRSIDLVTVIFLFDLCFFFSISFIRSRNCYFFNRFVFFFSRFCSVDFVELHVSSRCSLRHVRFHSSHVSCASSHTLSLLSSPSLAPLRVRFRLCRRPLFAPLRVRFSLLSSPVFCASSRTLSPLSSSVSCACLRTLLLLSPVSWTSSRMPLVVSFQFL